ncbi:MAG TPA: glycoside hydrolase family 15 protein [Candidatus Peribacterales bacterium]|nr:glycoside hydrolase family 15 protein [Candidatus Peribacterales bacterium]
MPRSLVLGNGSLLATFDQNLLLRDLYYPYVGEEDHTTYGHKHRVGFSIEGQPFSWLDDGSWKITPGYGDDTLIGISRLTNDRLGLIIEAHDFVHSVKNIFVRRFSIHSTHAEPRTLKIYFHHDLHMYGDKQKDTAFYEPATNSVIHYRKNRYFLVAGLAGNQGLTSFTTGKSEYRQLEGTWRDAEDGHLSRNPIEQGSVDSTVELTCTVQNDHEEITEFWLCAGKLLSDVLLLNDYVLEETTEQMERSTRNYWKSWVRKQRQTYGSLDDKLVNLFRRSLLIIRTQTDNHGGILAANDSDIMRFNRDTYTYVWPRDGAFVAMAMDEAGYHEMTRRFFRFCCGVQSKEGYMLHKYNPDGTPGSSWHPWWKNGEMQLPIQEDETALVLHAVWHHFSLYNDFEWLQEMYECFVKKAAEFMISYREQSTNLPLASYDPWEEHNGIFSYTSATVHAGLLAAANICQALGHVKHAERYHTAADEVREAILFHLYDEKAGRFVKKIKRKDGKEIERDLTPDASLMLIWKLGLLPPSDPRMSSTMKQVEEALRVRTSVGGYARYPRDFYHFNEQHSDAVPGNPWIITTLWIAEWKIALAKTLDDLKEPLATLHWVADKATPAGILPEQIDPHTGAHLSVAPLTWSHAVYVETFLMYLQKEIELRGAVSCPITK